MSDDPNCITPADMKDQLEATRISIGLYVYNGRTAIITVLLGSVMEGMTIKFIPIAISLTKIMRVQEYFSHFLPCPPKSFCKYTLHI